MKVYFVYDGEPDSNVQIVSTRKQREAYKAKITIPDKWTSGPCAQLLAFFVKTYNAKFPESPLAESEMHLKVGAVVLPLQDLVSSHIQEYNDIYVLHNVKVSMADQRPEGSLLCTNYGCGKYFLPADNNESSCHFHARPPVFHDTYKYWSCCPEQRAMDWEDFEKIPPCVSGPHSTENRQVSFKQEAITAVALSDEQQKAMAAGGSTAVMYEGNPKTGPREFEGALHGRQEPQTIVDGKATCRNFGCQQTFVVAENTSESCVHHSEGPVFWDTYKYWKCCPDKKKAEFDDFVKIGGCTVGPHKL